jgi:hypothetical protein
MFLVQCARKKTLYKKELDRAIFNELATMPSPIVSELRL